MEDRNELNKLALEFQQSQKVLTRKSLTSWKICYTTQSRLCVRSRIEVARNKIRRDLPVGRRARRGVFDIYRNPRKIFGEFALFEKLPTKT